VRRIRVVDSHTAGEPTRVVVDGGPDLGGGSVAARARRFAAEHRRDGAAIVAEPRGSGIAVGALLCAPVDRSVTAGVIFFNDVGTIGMCGHGTIGVAVTLAHLGRIGPGVHRIETPVGLVSVELHDRHRASVTTVSSYRAASGVAVHVQGYGEVVGDVAWGGNWFYLVASPGLDIAPDNVERLTAFARAVREALAAAGLRGADGAVVDHVEVHSPLGDRARGARSFVLCPGGAYDRSPCGTGTSAKLACLHAEGALRAGDAWRQESVIGTAFDASFAVDASDPRRIVPRITGSAYVTAEATLILDDDDPLCYGITPAAREARAAKA
jgi:4-hydroxyproline epimerase